MAWKPLGLRDFCQLSYDFIETAVTIYCCPERVSDTHCCMALSFRAGQLIGICDSWVHKIPKADIAT